MTGTLNDRTVEATPVGASAWDRFTTRALGTVRSLARPRWLIEIALIYGIYLLYSRVRNAGGKNSDVAFDNGDLVMGIERTLHIDVEQSINRWVHANSPIADLSALHYHTLHWWMTIGVAVWLYWRRHDVYRRGSMVLVLITLMALAGFYLMPTAPPRMYPGYVDIMAQTSSWGWWEASGSPGPQTLTNEFAAMPSLHCGWAMWAGLMLAMYARRTWVRVLGVIYPMTTVFVTVGTANHYWLDAVAIAAILAVAVAIVYLPPWSRWTEPLSRRRRASALTPGDDVIGTDDGDVTASTADEVDDRVSEPVR